MVEEVKIVFAYFSKKITYLGTLYVKIKSPYKPYRLCTQSYLDNSIHLHMYVHMQNEYSLRTSVILFKEKEITKLFNPFLFFYQKRVGEVFLSEFLCQVLSVLKTGFPTGAIRVPECFESFVHYSKSRCF